MTQPHTLLTATEVREILYAHERDVDKMAKLTAAAPADLPATHALIAGLAGGQWKVVLGCARALGRATAESAEAAVVGLAHCLNHPYPEVRTEAGRSLARLSFHAELPLEPIWEAFVGDEETHAFLAIGQALVSSLRSGCPAPPTWGVTLEAILDDILELRLTELPLSRRIPERHIMTLSEPSSSPGFVARLMGRREPPQLVRRNDPAPRPVRAENRRFLVDQGDRYRDTPELISLIATVYSYVPGNPGARLALILKLCQMPLASFATSEALVLLAAGLVRDHPSKTAFLASMWGWGRSYEPTWTGRLALSAAQARPDLRLQLLQFLRARQSRIDWAGWAASLRDLRPVDLEPLVAAALAAPESELRSWIKLLSQAPVKEVVPALARALRCPEKQVASEALERLLEYGQPVPWLLNDIHHLREQWADELTIVQGLEALMRLAVSTPTPLPAGKREPDLTVEWTLEDSAANPFLQGQLLSWEEALQQLNAFYLGGDELHLSTTSVMVTLSPERDPLVRALPAETNGAGIVFLAAGPQGEMLLAGQGQSQIHLYLLPIDAVEFARFEPSLAASELPTAREVMFDGDGFGWTKTVETAARADGELSLRKEIAYRADSDSLTLQSVWNDSMQALDTVRLETSDPLLSPLGFQFSSCGGYRVCESEGLAIRTGLENPIHSQGRVDKGLALHLEVFPSRLCRVYLWDRRSSLQ